MIDYVKISIKDLDILKIKDKLHSVLEVAGDTGEVLTEIIKIHYCTLRIRGNTIDFVGSIHKLYNSLKGTKAPNYKVNEVYSGYNGNDFTLTNILEVKKYLCELLECEPQQMIFQNMEIGINNNVGFNPQLFVKGLLFHNGKDFESKYDRNYVQAKHQKYYIKIYNKSKQYGMNTNVLRFEVSLKRAKAINILGIKTFEDVNTETLNNAKELLLKRLNEVVYYDYTIDKGTLTERKINLLDKYVDVNYWLDELRPQHRHREKKKLSDLIVKYSDNLKEQIKQEITKKCVIINRVKNFEKCVINTQHFKHKIETLKKQKCVIITPLSIGVNITQQGSENTSIIPLNKNNDFDSKKVVNLVSEINPSQKGCNETITGRKKVCLVTGLKLDLESTAAKYIRTKTLRYLQEHKKEVFESLVSDLLSKSYKRPKWESSLITHLAKQIKNRYYNSTKPRKNRVLKQDSNQLAIF